MSKLLPPDVVEKTLRGVGRNRRTEKGQPGTAGYIASTLPCREGTSGRRLLLRPVSRYRFGIPILLQKFPDYQQTLIFAENISDQPLPVVERERHATDHATLGYLVARGWFLPEAICEGILYHHDASVFDDQDNLSSLTLTLIAINAMAEHFHDEHFRLRGNSRWAMIGGRALDHLGLHDDEYCDLREDLASMFV
jgi:hypothetical protein